MNSEKTETSPAKKKSKKGKASREYFKKRKSALYLSRIETATRLGCSVMTLLNWEKRGLITPLRFGRNMLRYKIEDILKLEQEAIVAGSR